MVAIKNKKWFKSKTLWINILGMIAGIATAFQGELLTGSSITLATALNIILRIVTKQPISN